MFRIDVHNNITPLMMLDETNKSRSESGKKFFSIESQPGVDNRW